MGNDWGERKLGSMFFNIFKTSDNGGIQFKKSCDQSQIRI